MASRQKMNYGREYPSFLLPSNAKPKKRTSSSTSTTPPHHHPVEKKENGIMPKRLCCRPEVLTPTTTHHTKNSPQPQVEKNQPTIETIKNNPPVEEKENPRTVEIEQVQQEEEEEEEELQLHVVYKEVDSGNMHSLYTLPVSSPASPDAQELYPVVKFKNSFPGSKIFVWGSRIYMFGGVSPDEEPVIDKQLSIKHSRVMCRMTWKKDSFYIDIPSSSTSLSLAAADSEGFNKCPMQKPGKPMNGGKYCPHVIPVHNDGRDKLCVFNSDLAGALSSSGLPNFELFDPDEETWTALPEPFPFNNYNDFVLGNRCFRIKEYCVINSRLYISLPTHGLCSFIDLNRPSAGWKHAMDMGPGLTSVPCSWLEGPAVESYNLCVSPAAPFEFDGETPAMCKQLVFSSPTKENQGIAALFGGNVIGSSMYPLARRKLCRVEICRSNYVTLGLKVFGFRKGDNRDLTAGSCSQLFETSCVLRCLSSFGDGCLVGCFTSKCARLALT